MTDGAVVTQSGTDLETVELGIVRASSPAQLVAKATEAANALAQVIESRKLYSVISGKRFVRCEGWVTLAAMMGFIPREVSNVIRVEDGAYEATVELVRLSDGLPLARATAECGKDEPSWAKRPGYARRSMAATRATSKACRQAFSWVMALTGFEVTPAEEIPNRGVDVVEYTQNMPAVLSEPLSEMPAALAEDEERGDRLTGDDLKDIFTLVLKSGIDKKAFPGWYEKVMMRPWDGFVYQTDLHAIRAECSKLIAKKGAKA